MVLRWDYRCLPTLHREGSQVLGLRTVLVWCRYAANGVREIIDPASETPRNKTHNPRSGEGLDGWVIVQESLSGRPVKWFTYHNNDVWRWVSVGAKAEVFPTKKIAEDTAVNCSVYYRSDYKVVSRS